MSRPDPFLLLPLLLVLSGCVAREVVRPPCPSCDVLKTLTEKLARSPKAVLRGEKLLVPRTLARLYREESYQSLWSSEGCLLPRVDELLTALRKADQEGLNPLEYHLRKIEAMQSAWNRRPGQKALDLKEEAEMDLLLSDAYLGYASHLLGGHTDPEMERLQWRTIRRKSDLVAAFQSAVASNQILSSLEALLPQHPGYLRLKSALERYRRLAQAGQKAPPAGRLHQIKFSMDRWRWLPQDLGPRYILVNIPEFTLYAVEGGSRALSLPVIVGRKEEENATPIFSDAMTYLEFSPVWNVPKGISIREMLEKIQENLSFLAKNHLEVVLGKDDSAAVVNPKSLDWCEFTPNYFPYRLRQRPGPWNSLGQVKFMFPNQFNIYIHGSPAKSLFDRRLRTLSHGCVRIGDPVALAKWVLRDPDWTEERIKKYMNQPQPIPVPLGEPVPVYLVYWTAWVEEDETVNFREDIYGLDREWRRRFYP